MFSLFNRSMPQERLSANEIVDRLESEAISNQDKQKEIGLFGKDFRTRHHNSYLLQALAWNRLIAANLLVEFDKDKIALNQKDDWPTCLNTPLVLAAKTHANVVLESLIKAGADLDSQDYRGFTALHYACLLRNLSAINCLLKAGASTHIRDAFGHLPCDYYAMTMTKNDVTYAYGSNGANLKTVSDMDNHYFATQKKCFSALRWYICHLVVNLQLGTNELLKQSTLYNLAKSHLILRKPVENVFLYDRFMQLFCDARPELDQAVMKKLIPDASFLNAYNDEKFDQYRLCTADLIPYSMMFIKKQCQKNDEVWIELPEIKRSI